MMFTDSKVRLRRRLVAGVTGFLLLAVGVGTAQANSSFHKAAKSKTIILHHWSWLSASDGDVWAKMIAAFNAAHKNKSVQIKMQVIGDTTEYNTKVLAGVATGTAPDFGWGTGGVEAQWVKEGVVVPLDKLATAAHLNLKDFTVAALKTARYPKYGNKLFMIPMDAMSEAMLVNVDQVKAAGLDINNPPKTGAELLKWAEALTVRDASGTVTRSGIMMTGSGVQPSITWGMVADQMGFKRANAKLTTACVNPNAGKAAMQWVVDLFDKYKVSTRDVTDRYKAFGTGQGSMFWTGPWAIKGNLDLGLNFISVPLPTIGTTQSTYYELGGLEMYKQKDPTRYKATMDAIKWLSDNSFLWTTKGRGASTRTSILNRKDYLTAGFPLAVRGAFISSMKFATLAPIPVLASDDFQVYSGSSFISTQVASVLAGKLTVDNFMTSTCAKWQQDLNAG